MAIASVARKATIRRDDTILKTHALVQRQKQVAKNLELQQQKIEADREEAKTKTSTKNLELAMKTGNIENTKFAKDFAPEVAKFEELSNSGASQQDIQNQILRMDNLTKTSKAAMTDINDINSSLVGTEEQRRHMNKDAVTRNLAKYVEGVTSLEFDKSDALAAAKSTSDAYNMPNIVDDWKKLQQKNVATAISTKNIAGGLFSQVTEKKQAANFLVLKEDGTGYKMKDGKPIVVISEENLESFESYSDGAKLAIDEHIEANEGATRLQAMESILRESGAFNIDEATSTTIKTNPKEDSAAAALRTKLANVSDRLDFIQSPNEMMGVIQGGKGVVAKGTVTTVDGKAKEYTTKKVKKPNGDLEYTIVVDPKRLQNVQVMGVDVPDGRGGTGRMTVIGDKADKIQVRKITVKKDDPMQGLLQLSLVYNATVDAKYRVDSDDLLKEWNQRQEKASKDVVDLTNIGGGNKTEEKKDDGVIDLTNIGGTN